MMIDNDKKIIIINLLFTMLIDLIIYCYHHNGMMKLYIMLYILFYQLIKKGLKCYIFRNGDNNYNVLQ